MENTQRNTLRRVNRLMKQIGVSRDLAENIDDARQRLKECPKWLLGADLHRKLHRGW